MDEGSAEVQTQVQARPVVFATEERPDNNRKIMTNLRAIKSTFNGWYNYFADERKRRGEDEDVDRFQKWALGKTLLRGELKKLKLKEAGPEVVDGSVKAIIAYFDGEAPDALRSWLKDKIEQYDLGILVNEKDTPVQIKLLREGVNYHRDLKEKFEIIDKRK